MKPAKQNTILQSIDQHRITLIESKQWFTTICSNSTKQRMCCADDGYKKNRPSEASATDEAQSCV